MSEEHDGLMPVEQEMVRLMNEARVNAGVSIPRLAEHLGVAVSTMNTRVTGYQIKTLKVGDVVRVCDSIGVDAGRLLGTAAKTAGLTAATIKGVWKNPRNKKVRPVTEAQNNLPAVEEALTKLVNQTRADAGVSIPTLALHLGWGANVTSRRVTGYFRKSLRLADTVAICDAIAVHAGDLLGQARERAGASIELIEGVEVPDRHCEYRRCGQPLPKFDLDTHRAEGKRYMLATRRYCNDQHRWQAASDRNRKSA